MEKSVRENMQERNSRSPETGYYTDRKNGYAEAVWGNAPL